MSKNLHESQLQRYLEWLPHRVENAHKGLCGRIGIVAGSDTMLGAAILTARAALRAGAGAVYLMTVSSAIPIINIVYPEIIVLPLTNRLGVISLWAWDEIEKYYQTFHFNCLAIGPGLTTSQDIRKLIEKLLPRFIKTTPIPMVFDADALNASTPKTFSEYPNQKIVLTPHPKEFERLFGQASGADAESRISAAAEAAKRINQVVLLKGHNTIISDGNQIITNETGNAGMATAGSGDVLTGIIAALIGQNVAPFEAAALGAYLHGAAGDRVYAKKGVGLVASDVIEAIPDCLHTLKKKHRIK